MKHFGNDWRVMFLLPVVVLLSAPLVFFVPLLVPFVLGVIPLLFGIGQIKKYKSLEGWVEVNGNLIQTELGVYDVSVGQYTPPVSHYFPLAQFSYSFNGNEYNSNMYALDRKSVWSTNKDDVLNCIERLKSEDSLKVFVNPQSPEEAVVNLSVSKKRWSHAYALTLGGLILILSGAALVITANNGN